jgi:SAM-dependent methyltransferase
MSMGLTLEAVSCPLCGADTPGPFMQAPDRVHGVPGTFTLVRCRGCDLVYLNPRPAAGSLATIYPPDYGPYQNQPIVPGHLHPDLRRACEFVHRHQPRAGRLLDIGCGPGRFLQAMRLLHPAWQLAGVEPDAAAAALASAAGLSVQHATIEHAVLEPHSCDAVTLWNVLEHLPDPLAMLGRARQLLRSGGTLYLSVPLYDSWDARIFGRYWTGWELPRHFTHFERSTLARMLELAGFQAIGTACIDGRSYGFSASLRLLIQERVRSFALRRLGEAVTYSRPLALALAPYTALSVAAQRCTVRTLAARPV